MKYFKIRFSSNIHVKNKVGEKLILSKKQSAEQHRKHMNYDFYFVIKIHTQETGWAGITNC